MKFLSFFWFLSATALLAALAISCGKGSDSKRKVQDGGNVLDDNRNVMDGTGFSVASKAELDTTIQGSRALADVSLGRMFDFDDGVMAAAAGGTAADIQNSIFCDGEFVVTDEAWHVPPEGKSAGQLKLKFEADVTACVAKPLAIFMPPESVALAGDDTMIVDRQIAAFTLTFACSSRDLSKAVQDRKASSVMATTGAAFSCPASGQSKPITGRAYRYAGRVDGRYVGPRSEVPVQQRFWRGYDDGSDGRPCLLSRGSAATESAGDRLGACRLFERSELLNLVDNSKAGRLLKATASVRTKNGSLFTDGDLGVQVNGWAASTRFSSQDTNIKLIFNRPSGECAAFQLRPSAVTFEAQACQ